jgi:hypothetical protein
MFFSYSEQVSKLVGRPHRSFLFLATPIRCITGPLQKTVRFRALASILFSLVPANPHAHHWQLAGLPITAANVHGRPPLALPGMQSIPPFHRPLNIAHHHQPRRVSAGENPAEVAEDGGPCFSPPQRQNKEPRPVSSFLLFRLALCSCQLSLASVVVRK